MYDLLQWTATHVQLGIPLLHVRTYIGVVLGGIIFLPPLCIVIWYFRFCIVIHQLMCLHTKESRQCCLACTLIYHNLMDTTLCNLHTVLRNLIQEG